ncbi:TPA: site-specific integrase [Legionella pneumophila]|uniref:tyrosine-type recombinase/integrase n=1 Tax=Legionella pneumophila TaxID=446 RepID=UPI001A2967D7|nr:site-specific integrase [Legionella pneumophila]MDI9826320.1 site-specific integrase [Legionella pneumophila]HAU0908752.1 site-specific integrase [Legionella pneumophila]HAU1359123.1 site-specific integrase [Legionella pneumophila]HAU1458288.1 site-specific integrase [Legionella pneumophila]HBD7231036.1 site-specific integrase [Legionella pneumophila]
MAREGKAKVLTENEFKLLLLVAKEGKFATRNLAIIYCSFGLGLRAKEIASLTIADVTNSQYQLLDELSLRRSMTKGDKQRHVYLTHKKIRDILQAHVNELKSEPRHKPFFQTQRKSRFTANTLQKWFRALYDKAGIVGASSHSGRRTFITRLIEQGADIKAVSRLAGHANIVTTAIYVEDNPERLKRIANLALF